MYSHHTPQSARCTMVSELRELGLGNETQKAFFMQKIISEGRNDFPKSSAQVMKLKF
jgi:hypothetical protein